MIKLHTPTSLARFICQNYSSFLLSKTTKQIKPKMTTEIYRILDPGA